MLTLGIQGGKPDWYKILKAVLLAAIIFFAFCFLLSSCTTEAKKLAKAKQLVLTNQPAFDSLGEVYLLLHPCINKITVHSDTTYQHDTTETFYHYTDTVNNTDTVVIKQVIHDKQIIHDTLKVVDDQQIKILNSQITNKDLQIAGMNGQIKAAHDATTEAQGTANKWKLWFWGLAALIGASGIYKLVKMFSPTKAGTSIVDEIAKKI